VVVQCLDVEVLWKRISYLEWSLNEDLVPLLHFFILDHLDDYVLVVLRQHLNSFWLLAFSHFDGLQQLIDAHLVRELVEFGETQRKTGFRKANREWCGIVEFS
jgi:hypothetical protein